MGHYLQGLRAGLRVAGLAGAALAGASLAAPAGAVELKAVGAWSVFRTETSDGTTICGMSNALSEGRVFYLKWYKGDDYLTVQAFKPSWQIPAGVKAKVSLTFTGNTPWNATSAPSNKASSIVEFNFPKKVVKPFVKEFTTSTAGTLEFAGGSEAPWTMDTSGSAGALDVMAQCIEGVVGPGVETPLSYLRQPPPAFGSTQPFSGGQPGAPPSQPFSGGQPAAPRPSQPF